MTLDATWLQQTHHESPLSPLHAADHIGRRASARSRRTLPRLGAARHHMLLMKGSQADMTETVRATFSFRLYVAGNAVNSAHALANLHALCRSHLAGRHSIEVVDALSEPERARADGVTMTPTLLKLAPAPRRRIVGTLRDTATVMQLLDLPRLGASA
ncbi:MAG: circadian clock KaiB family protein [Rhizobacter sp.]|nr:circadian clock KaiB family protein [Rhizobacter sp.]